MNSPEHTELVPVQDQLFKKRRLEDKYRDDFFTIFLTPYAEKIMRSLSGRQRTILYTLLSFWNYRKRDIETSIAQIKEKLKETGIDIGTQHISTAISDLQNAGALRKLESGHNRLVVKLNPFLCWKGYARDNNHARANEILDWPRIQNPIRNLEGP